MELFNTYQTCCKVAFQTIKDIESPYEKAQICTNIMNSIATLLSSSNIEKILENTDSVKKTAKTKKPKTENDTENTSIEPVVDIVTENIETANNIASENTKNESVVQSANISTEEIQENFVEDNNTEPTESVIDKTDDNDDDTWTDRMTEKYKEEIEYINSIYEEYEEKSINDFIAANSNNLYHSFNEMNPREFIANYTIFRQAIE